MSKLNLLVHLNAYDDETATNTPTRNNVKWNRELQGIDISEPESKSLRLPAGQTLELFSGTVSTSDDVTTTFDLALKAGTSNTYRLSHNAGTAPAFKTARTHGGAADTTASVTKNGKLLTFTSDGGTAFALIAGGAIVGDEVRIAGDFNAVNQGKFKILALTATSFTIENELGQAEGPITLGADFVNVVNIYSVDGVQIADKVDILAGLSSVSFGTYEITDVSHDYIEFYSSDSLPAESGVVNTTPIMAIYRDAKQFIYLETDQKLDIKINGSATPNQVEPFSIGTTKGPGIFMSGASLKSVEITNQTQNTANIFYVVAE